MTKLNIFPHPPMIGVRPSPLYRIQDDFPNLTIGHDPLTGRYLVRPADFPELVSTAVAAGMGLHPDPGLADYLRSVADDLDDAEDHLDALDLPHTPFVFQRQGIAHLTTARPVAFLFDEMGLGKTVQALGAIRPGASVLVVCPASLRRNWATECRKWRGDLSPVVVERGNDFRWPEPGEVVIVSYHGTPPKPDKHGKAPEGLIVIADECHKVKNYGSSKTPVKTTRRFRMLARRAIKHSGQVWMMTGTPVLSHPGELWSLLQAVGLGPELYMSHGRFIRLFGGYRDGLGQTFWDSAKVHPEAMDPLRGVVLRRRRADVLPDMPAKMWTERQVELLVPKDVEAELEDAYGKLLALAAEAAADSLEYYGGIDQLARARQSLATAKLPAVLDLAEEFRQAGEPLVVFSAHRKPVEALGELPGWRCIHGAVPMGERQKSVEDFQAGKLAGIALTIGAGGTGITLTRAAHVAFVDRAWTPAENDQAEDRVARIGQTRPVTVISLVADHPLDRHIHKLLTRKQVTVDNTTERLNEGGDDIDRRALAKTLRHLATQVEGAAGTA